MIETAARFNNGNGGVSVIITKTVEAGKRTGGIVGYETVEVGELLSPRKAIDLALELIHKAVDSVPDELDAAIRDLKTSKGMW